MKRFLLLVAALLFPLANGCATEPSADKAAVLAVVQQFFDAMKSRDAEGIRQTYLPGTQYALGVPGNDGYIAKGKTVEALITDVKQDTRPWIERIWNPTVLIEGRIATVWARYDFHKGGKFTHNGTDCYTLLKTDTGWKIAGLVFTIEPGSRTENPAGPPQ